MKAALIIFYQIALVRAFVPKSATVAGRPTSIFAKKQSDQVPTEEVDVVVIGSGLAGLSCAALLSHCDKKTVVLEAHDTPGGAVSPNRNGLFRNLVLRRVLLGKSFSFYLHWNLFSDLLARPPLLIFLSRLSFVSLCQKPVSFGTTDAQAHGWERRGFHFESGPSLYSGFSTDESPNPLKNIFQIIGEDAEWITYDRWGTVMPDGRKFAAKIGPEEFGDVLKEHGGPNAEKEFAALMERMGPLSYAAQALTSLALREDAGAALTLLRYPKELFATMRQGQALNEPFSKIMDEMELEDKFVKNWLDMLCFLLQGLPASGTMNAVMAYMVCTISFSRL